VLPIISWQYGHFFILNHSYITKCSNTTAV